MQVAFELALKGYDRDQQLEGRFLQRAYEDPEEGFTFRRYHAPAERGEQK